MCDTTTNGAKVIIEIILKSFPAYTKLFANISGGFNYLNLLITNNVM